MDILQLIQQGLLGVSDFADAGPFPADPALTGMVTAYRNDKLIADEVLPFVPVEAEEFTWEEYPKGTFYTVPPTLVGRKGVPNQVEHASIEQTASTDDHALIDLVPSKDIEKYGRIGIDAVARATEYIFALIKLARELRAAAIVADTDNYGGSVTLAGDDQFSSAATSDPIAVISTALDAPLMRPNIMTLGRPVFSVLARHPDIVKAANKTSGDTGIVSKQDIADLFELDEVLVGEAQVNVAKPGKPASFQRAWGKHISLTYRDKSASTRHGFTWGLTARWGNPVAGQIPYPLAGLRGGVYIKTGEAVRELVMAPDAGYLIRNAVA